MSKLTVALILASTVFMLAHHAGAQVTTCNDVPIDLTLNYVADPTQINSPNYPENYPNNCMVQWSISNMDPGFPVTFRLLDFELESGFDNVRIFESGNLLANFTGTYDPLPEIVTASSGVMQVEFTSDHSITFVGFLAEVNAL